MNTNIIELLFNNCLDLNIEQMHTFKRKHNIIFNICDFFDIELKHLPKCHFYRGLFQSEYVDYVRNLCKWQMANIFVIGQTLRH